MFKNMNTERASYFTERSYTTSEAENKKDIFEYWKKILGEDTLRVAEKCYGIDLVKVLNSENYVCENNHVMSEMEKVKIELFEKPINYNYSGFKGEKLAFDNFFIPLINYGIDILKNGTSLFLTDSIIDTYANTLLERLGKISLGILMFEMYLCKKTGKLNGRNSEEEYDYYNNNFLSKKSYKQELFNIYPCLLRSVTETVENLSSYYVLLLERLNKDKNEIANKFCGGLEFKNVVEISSNISDSHKKGNGVSILKLDNGIKIVYKPRSLKIEKVYFDFLGKINAGCKYEMYEPKILDCQEYGWEEFVYYKSCKTEDEIRRYFYRFGILIFGSYILNTNDLHEENVIATGEYPIIIDAETILDNRRRGRTNSAKEEINYILHESVLYSGLLPHYRFSNLGHGVDMSAIKGSEGKEYPIVIPKIADLCTSNMRFVYEHPTTGVNQNLVKLDGENVSAFHYLKEINAGFEDAYKYVLENKEKFLEYSDMFGNLNIRHLVQDTQRYSMLLHTSFHPDFMQDGRDRQMFLCSLFKQYEATQGDKGVVKCEIKDMLNMDIPYFYLNTSGKSLFGSEGEKIEDYFEYTSLEHLKKKIVLLEEDDLKRQLMFMNIILTEINEFQVEDKKIELQQMKMIPHREKNKAHLLKAVQKLADSLIKTAVFNKDRTEVNWIGVTLIGNEDDCSWDIRPLGTYLYEGMSGLAIFFNALYAVDPQKEYLIICNAIEKELFTYTDEMCERNEGIENESSGAFGGEASIMYTYEVLYKITNKEKYLDYAKKHYKILKKAITRDSSFDLVYGNAGAVITLINMYQLTGNKEYIASAEIAGDIIVNAQEKEGSIKGGWNGDGRTSPLAGFSHGASGIVLALAKLWQVTQKEEYLLSLLDGIKFENSLFVKEKGNWKDERVYAGEKASDGGSFTVAWCHGAAGILLSRSKVNVILNGRYSDLIENDIKVAVNTILKEGILGNNCLCHGNLGNTEILFEYLKDHSDKKIEKYYVDIRDIIAENVCNGVFDCDNAYLYGYKLQGFMTGLCGMGYSLLRDIKKDLPCVIALEV